MINPGYFWNKIRIVLLFLGFLRVDINRNQQREATVRKKLPLGYFPYGDRGVPDNWTGSKIFEALNRIFQKFRSKGEEREGGWSRLFEKMSIFFSQ